MDEEPSKSPVKPAAAADSETELFVSSYLVKSIARHGLDEDYVKQKWRSAPVEDKKRIEEMYKLLRAKEVEYVLFKTQFLNETNIVE
ncbi:unnamed protein product [Arabis nemorensis]|uniref:Glabrous enhancer-binding protein-like C-terminal domain-containing protein n=1 Tax=Arabis nemorensis TaxID=586526 RepID=A0A565BDR3_9BRAS|nr:unnamed protein product [Arabis nemorensis]